MMTVTVHPQEPEDDFGLLQAAIRQHNAKKIQTLVESLEPQIDGSFGPVNPRLIEVYLKALRELASLYRAYDRPAGGGDEEPAALRTEAQMRELAAAQLRELAARQQGQAL